MSLQCYGSRTEYQTQSPDQDPLRSEGDIFRLLYDNDYDEFFTDIKKVRKQLWNLDGVKEEESLHNRRGIRAFRHIQRLNARWKRRYLSEETM